MTKYAAICESGLLSGLCIRSGAGPVFAPSCIRRRWKSLLTLFRVFQLRFQMTARETYWFVSGFLKGWSVKLVGFIQFSFPICCYVCWLSSWQVCSNNLTLKLSAVVFSSCLAAFLGVERRCGSDTTQYYCIISKRIFCWLPDLFLLFFTHSAFAPNWLYDCLC